MSPRGAFCDKCESKLLHFIFSTRDAGPSQPHSSCTAVPLMPNFVYIGSCIQWLLQQPKRVGLGVDDSLPVSHLARLCKITGELKLIKENANGRHACVTYIPRKRTSILSPARHLPLTLIGTGFTRKTYGVRGADCYGRALHSSMRSGRTLWPGTGLGGCIWVLLEMHGGCPDRSSSKMCPKGLSVRALSASDSSAR